MTSRSRCQPRPSPRSTGSSQAGSPQEGSTGSSHGRRSRWPALAALALVATLGGCTLVSNGYAPPVTVTVTPTVTVTAKAAPSPTPTPARTNAPVTSQVVGRGYDVGTITGVEMVQQTPVLVFDRWTVRGVSDSRLAREGTSLTPHTSERFSNRNVISFKIPVDVNATFTKQTCVAVGQAAKSERTDLAGIRALTGRAAIVQLTLNPSGWVTNITSDPVCG